jgi:hypothetical protein
MGLFEWIGMGAARADTPDARAPRLASADSFFQGPPLELLKAAIASDDAEARRLVAQGVDPNSHGPASKSKATPQLTLLNYATGVQNERAMATLIAVGADPLFEPRDDDGDAFLFAVVRHDAKMLDVLYRLFPMSRIPAKRQSDDAFAALNFNANTCLQVMFDRGLPPGVLDSRGDNLFMEALDREDFDTAEWLLVKVGVPIDIPPDRTGNTPANMVQRALTEVFRPGSPSYERYEKFKRLMEQKGIVFPVESSADWRARMKGQRPPGASAAGR